METIVPLHVRFCRRDTMYRHARRVAFVLAWLGASSPAVAQFDPQWGFNGAPQATQLHSSYVLQQIANGTYLRGTKSTSKPAPSTKPTPVNKTAVPMTFDTRSQPIVPATLARSYPRAARPKVEQFFGQTLEAYHKIESQFGLRHNDLAGALAAFVAGNYAAYRNEAFPDRLFKPLVQQMQDVLQSSGTLDKTSVTEKQELYENLAILGTYMLLTREALQKSPDDKVAANMKTAARGYLEQALKLDPDRMQLTEQGLVAN
jgi:hypothetical protein